jgi:glycosyltransferase involved in cell wall biosynthesis
MSLKLSIITPSFNQGRFLEETIMSVLNQGYEPLEYIVIDGGSTDESVSIIQRYEDKLAYWISEKDRGQVHAINKGIEHATGDLLAFINSDDVYLPGAFNAVCGDEPLCR